MGFRVRKTARNRWTVGYQSADGSWIPESDHRAATAARERLAALEKMAETGYGAFLEGMVAADPVAMGIAGITKVRRSPATHPDTAPGCPPNCLDTIDTKE